MLKIRKEQMDAFSEAALRSFEGRMAAHLGEFFPKQCKALGEAHVRDTIRYGIERAKTFGIVSSRDVAKYVVLMIALGRNFDGDPKLPWAGDILRDSELADPGVRVDLLYDEAVDFFGDGEGA